MVVMDKDVHASQQSKMRTTLTDSQSATGSVKTFFCISRGDIKVTSSYVCVCVHVCVCTHVSTCECVCMLC